MDHFEDGKAEENNKEENNKEENNKDGHDNDNNVDGDKPNAKLPQHNTMVGTAKVCIHAKCQEIQLEYCCAWK